jgi:hypothetical protein
MGMTRGHRKLVKHYHEPGDLHELTFSCYHRLHLLTSDTWRERLARFIDLAGEQTDKITRSIGKASGTEANPKLHLRRISRFGILRSRMGQRRFRANFS